MKKKLRWGIIILSIFVLVVILIITLIQLEIDNRKNKAIDVAVKYLEDTYTEKMNYKSIRQSFEPSGYHVYFSPKNNPHITFEVSVNADFTLTQKPYKFNPDYNWVPDNYLLKYFNFHFSNEIQQMTDDVWDEETECVTSFNGNGLSSYRVSKNLSEYMSFEEMEPYLEYDLDIWIDKKWMDKDKLTEAGRILEFINKVQASGYSPDEICFIYRFFGESIFFYYKDWDEISDIAQIEEKLD